MTKLIRTCHCSLHLKIRLIFMLAPQNCSLWVLISVLIHLFKCRVSVCGSPDSCVCHCVSHLCYISWQEPQAVCQYLVSLGDKRIISWCWLSERAACFPAPFAARYGHVMRFWLMGCEQKGYVQFSSCALNWRRMPLPSASPLSFCLACGSNGGNQWIRPPSGSSRTTEQKAPGCLTVLEN